MFSPRISTRRLADLCRRLGTALAAGVEVRQVWNREASRGGLAQQRRARLISEAVARGDSVSDGIALTGNYFPPLFRSLVDVGERTGKLAEVLIRLAEHYDQRIKIRRIFLSGITWPLIQLFAAVCIIGLLIWIMGIISEFVGERVDVLGLGLVGTQGLMIYLAWVAGIVAVAGLLIRANSRGWFWTAPIQRLMLLMPVLGPSLRTLALSRMAWTLSLTTDSQMDIRPAVKIALESTHNAGYTRLTRQVDEVLAQGEEVHTALGRTGEFPDDFLDALEVGEQSGRMSESMATLSSQYQDRAWAALATLSTIAGFLVWAAVGIVIVAVIFKLFFFYIGMINNFAKGI